MVFLYIDIERDGQMRKEGREILEIEIHMDRGEMREKTESTEVR